jgi:NAD-dependent deacetylase
LIQKAAKFIKSAKRISAFTGAGISVESGIPPFRGKNGLWGKYNPEILNIDYFRKNPHKAWALIREIFYGCYGGAEPNMAHRALAAMEAHGYLHSIITLNIDNLHQKSGSKEVCEFHGSLQYLVCLNCLRRYPLERVDLRFIPPLCPDCGGLLKPDFVFFGEPIAEAVKTKILHEVQHSDVFLVIGTSGEIDPAARIPHFAKANGAVIIEVNPDITKYTATITDIILQGNAAAMMKKLVHVLEIYCD